MRIFTTVLLFTTQFLIAQQADTLHVGTLFKDFDKLNYQSYEYEVYSEREGQKSLSVLMRSTTTKEKIDGRKYIAIRHTWSSPNFNGNFYALVEPKTLRPIIQIRNREQGKEAYRFSDQQIVGLDTAANNLAADYQLELPFPVFNFEIDLETFSILPFEENKTFLLPFFHAGSKSQPAFYVIKVEKLEKLDISGKGAVPCWVLFMDYGGMQPTRFWYTKKDRQFVKMEATYKGANIFKVRKF